MFDLNKKEKTKKLRRSRFEGILVEVSVATHRTCIYASINAIQVRLIKLLFFISLFSFQLLHLFC